MKYKEKFLNLQITVSDRYKEILNEFHEIESVLNNIQINLDGRRSELSPELYKDLTEKLCDAVYKCSFNSLMQRRYYGDNNQ